MATTSNAPFPEGIDLVFKTVSGQPTNADCLAKRFRLILEAAGLPKIRLYDLRHTAATLALAAGVSPKVVSEQLGHASTAFTLDTYAHVLPHMQDEAAAKVEKCSLGGGAWSLTEHLLLGTRYLTNSVLELNEAAYLLGYNDANSFVRAFRAWEGVPPARWREQQRANAAS